MAKKTIGRELAERFTRFAAELDQTDSPERRFTIRGLRVADPPPHDPELIRQTRRILNVSQPVFAGLLGVSVASLRDWEQGLNEPPGVACRLMTAIRLQPDFWLAQLQSLVTPIELARNGRSGKPSRAQIFRRQPRRATGERSTSKSQPNRRPDHPPR